LRRSRWSSGLVVAALAVLAAAAAAQTRRAHPVRTAARSEPSAEQIAAAKAYGIRTAPIMIEEFSDFECPACRELYMGTLRPLIDDYCPQGKVYLVHHDFPLPVHQYARSAALYANAAAAIGRFEPVERALFTRQPEWSANGRVRDVVAGALTAAEMKRVDALVKSPAVAAAVEHDVELGRQAGVQRTPTMFISFRGQRTPVIGVVSYDVLRRFLNSLLASR